MLLAGLSLTAYSLHVTRQGNRDTALMTFNQYVDRLDAAVQTQFRQPLYGIRGAIGAQASTNTSGEMKRANFHAYVAARDIATEFPGIRGFGYVERVQRPDIARFEAAEKHDQSPFFRIKTHGNANELYVVKYLEPLAGNEAAIGLDLGAEAVRREAVERAINTGEPSLSGVMSLVQDDRQGPGFLYLVPLFPDGTTPDTPQSRRALLTGLFYSPLTAHELLHSTRAITHGDIDFEIYDGATASPDTLVFSSQPSVNSAAAPMAPTDFKAGRAFSDVRGLVIGGRLLTLRSGSSALFEAEHNAASAWLVGAGGTVLSLLLALIVWLLLVARARAETLAHAMTADLGRLVNTQKSTNEQLTRAMRDSQSLLDAIDQHSMVSIANPAGDITYANDLFCVISGYSREELLGHNHRILQSDAQPAEFWRDLWHTIASGQVWRGVVCNRAKNGALYWINTVISPFLDDQGIEKYIAISTDITAARHAQLELTAERERLSHIILGTRTGTWEWNVQTDAFVINDRWADIIGYALPELNPVSVNLWLEHCHPDDMKVAKSLLAQHIAGALGYYECEIRMRHRDGHWVWIQERGKISSWTPDGKPEWMSGTHMDISERKNAAAQLSEQLQFVEVLLEATPTAIYIKDQAGRYVRFNKAFEALFEIDRADWIGKTVFDLVPGASAALMHAKDLDLLATGAAQVYEATFTQHRSAVVLEGHYCKAALRNNEGIITGLVGTITDVTARNRTARELLIAKNEAEAATTAKSQFLANMSHEIRTPMHAILGMLKLLQNTELSLRQLDYANKTERAAKSLLGLLNDILDFSKIDADKMTLDLQPFRLDQLMSELSVIASANLGNKPVALRFDVDPALPRTLVGDAMRLQQVLINLSGNAIKFTAQGEVRIQIQQLAQTGTDATLRVSVQDSGIGIAADQLEHIFTGFSQAEASTTRRFGGTGLGLSISRQLVALMGGELAVESVPGQGSTFYFTLTLPTADLLDDDTNIVITAPATTQRSLEGLRLLVVEDNPINQQVAQELLSHEGALIELAADGQLGVAAVAAANPPFDAVLMDLQMPVMDGFDATRAIRTVLGLTDLPIIAMTANAMASDRAACLAAGMDDHVGKPFNLPQLIKLLQTLTAKTASPNHAK
jgi:PAS domain S-box-containing protein